MTRDHEDEEVRVLFEEKRAALEENYPEWYGEYVAGVEFDGLIAELEVLRERCGEDGGAEMP